MAKARSAVVMESSRLKYARTASWYQTMNFKSPKRRYAVFSAGEGKSVALVNVPIREGPK